MIFHSRTPKTDCRKEITSSILWENSLFDLIASMLPENIHKYFSMYGKSRKHYEDTVYFNFDELPLKHT